MEKHVRKDQKTLSPLVRDAMQAKKLGMTYGEYKAKFYHPSETEKMRRKHG